MARAAWTWCFGSAFNSSSGFISGLQPGIRCSSTRSACSASQAPDGLAAVDRVPVGDHVDLAAGMPGEAVEERAEHP
ncbi:hypothetical protein WJ438_20935 [Streptomyces sp. GD-15H]